MVFTKQKEAIENRLETYLEAFMRVRSYLDKISQATQKKEEPARIREEIYFFNSYLDREREREPSDPPTTNPECFRELKRRDGWCNILCH
ncbi:MAG: hypothetical protein NY202_01315 [Mollicutes bacterium UO1]